MVVDLASDPRVHGLQAQADLNPAASTPRTSSRRRLKDIVDAYRETTRSSTSSSSAATTSSRSSATRTRHSSGRSRATFRRSSTRPLRGQPRPQLRPEPGRLRGQRPVNSECATRSPCPTSRSAGSSRRRASATTVSTPTSDHCRCRRRPRRRRSSPATTSWPTPRPRSRASLDAGIGANGDTLIAPNNISPTDPQSWTATQLKTRCSAPATTSSSSPATSAPTAPSPPTSARRSRPGPRRVDHELHELDRVQRRLPLGLQHRRRRGHPERHQPLDWPEAFAQKRATRSPARATSTATPTSSSTASSIYADFAHAAPLRHRSRSRSATHSSTPKQPTSSNPEPPRDRREGAARADALRPADAERQPADRPACRARWRGRGATPPIGPVVGASRVRPRVSGSPDFYRPTLDAEA